MMSQKVLYHHRPCAPGFERQGANKSLKGAAPMREQKGFSLIELLIVVAIIGIVATIAISALSRARRAAEESSAVGSLRAYSSAQYAYYAVRGNHQHFGEAAELADGFIEPAFVTSPVRNGYAFAFDLSDDR